MAELLENIFRMLSELMGSSIPIPPDDEEEEEEDWLGALGAGPFSEAAFWMSLTMDAGEDWRPWR